MPVITNNISFKCCLLGVIFLFWGVVDLISQTVVFPRDFSPAEGLVTIQEKPFRDEVCLNGLWELQCVPVPSSWKSGSGVAPELSLPQPNKWEKVKIKIPSAINVNDWGRGSNVGDGTQRPYVPSSVYFPSYPEHWKHTRMGWLRKNFRIPVEWEQKRVLLHFEAVAGDCLVLVNGQEVGSNFDSHLPFDLDISSYINRDAENELLVGVRHTKLFDKSHPLYKKMGATYPTGSNTDDLIGIWQDVYLLGVPEVRITDVFVQPWVDKNELILEIAMTNLTPKNKKITLGGVVKEWVNHAGKDVLTAPEISWSLGETVLTIPSEFVILRAGESKTITVRHQVNDVLKYWTPDTPYLYTLLLNVNDKKQTYDCKATRFGWRQFKIVGGEFQLNGKKIQCFGDIQHPFSAYICSRRFAYAWYQMIKDFGGNAVRPHAQPWPRVYYDLADEMGLMVLDETALFGSSIRLNFEEELTWQRSHEHLKRLILRDRNHPSVIGWSAGNETFAIALLNKPEKEVAAVWDDKLVDLTLSARKSDPTRDFITLDGDRDMEGRLPVWSKHFAHGLKLEDLPRNLNKPLIVGESGATYYGRPIQLYPFVGEKAFLSYEGRSEALAIDVYQNAKQMALPYLSYYSPSEVCWFGLEHMNLGYHHFERLPSLTDGIFAGKPYEEGKPGYQYERIPPYVTTFNPGLDPELPLYKPLPMFNALKAALTGGTWTPYQEVKHPAKPEFPLPLYEVACLFGTVQPELIDLKVESEHFLSYFAQIHYNTYDKGYFPSKGSDFKAAYSLYTDNMAQYNEQAPFSALSASWASVIPATRRFSIIPSIYGRVLIGKGIPYPLKNAIGGEVYGFYIPQQLPFAGVTNMELMENSIIITSLKFRQRMGSIHYLTLTGNYGLTDSHFFEILKGKQLFGISAGYGMDSVFGPLEISLGYSNQTDKGSCFVNLGYYF